MAAVDEALLRLLELSFLSPGDVHAGWKFLAALGAAISPDVRAVTLLESSLPAPTTMLFGVNIERVAAGHLPRRTGRGPRIEAMPPGSVFDLPRLPPRTARNEVVRSLLEPEGLLPGSGLGLVVTAENERASSLLLVLPVREGWTPSAANRALLTQLAPFVVQSTRLHLRLLGASALTTLLDHLVLGVVLTDERGRVSYVNRSAAEMLGVEPGESEPRESGTLDARSEALSRTGRRGSEGEGLFPHPMDGRPLHVWSTKLDWPSWQGYIGRRFARAHFIGDPKQGTSDPLANVGRLYGLTESETHLASLLAGDFSLAQAAEHLGITESTARTVLKRVLAKTGTRRQASLVRLLLSGPAQIRDDQPPRTDRHERSRPARRRRR